MECLETRVLMHGGVSYDIAFALPTTPVAEPFDADTGQVLQDNGEGIVYGWTSANSANLHVRHDVAAPDSLHRGYAVLPPADQNVWQIKVPNDDYEVTIVAGDAASTAGRYRINVDGVLTVNGSATANNPWVEGTSVVTVRNGLLTVSSAKGATSNKIDYISITPFDDATTISVTADPATQTRGAHGGGFIFSRSASVSDAATYQYIIGGSAQPGSDYAPLSGSVTFPAGASQVDLPITPDFTNLSGTKTVMVTLVPQPTFVIGNLSATTTIVGTNRNGTGSASPLAASSTSFSKTSINFQPGNAPMPDFFKADTGAAFGMRANGLQYGWNVDNSGNTRDRNSKNSPDQSYDTLTQMQAGGTFSWQMAVPNGNYTVRVVAGDPSFTDSIYKINVEGVLTVSGTPTSANHWVEGTKTVTVKDGKLTISNATGSKNNKIDFIVITPGGSSSALPVVSAAASGQPSESGATGTFTFTRTGSTAAALTVLYTLGGTATNGADYQALSGAATIPAGSASTSITIKPIDDSIAEGPETVVLTISPSSSYTTNTTATVSRTITDNDINTSTLGKLTWTAVANSPLGRSEAETATVNGKVYVFGGFSTIRLFCRDIGRMFMIRRRTSGRRSRICRARSRMPARRSSGTLFILREDTRRIRAGQRTGKRRSAFAMYGNTTPRRTPGLPGRRCRWRGPPAGWFC